MQRKSDIGRNLAIMLLISFPMVNLPVSHVEADFVPTSISDSTLARNFAPVLVLTKNPTRSGRKALHPEPVEIMGAESVRNVWFYSLPPGHFLTEGKLLNGERNYHFQSGISTSKTMTFSMSILPRTSSHF